MSEITTTQQNGALSADDMELLKGSAAHAPEFKDEDKQTTWLTIVQSMSPYVKSDDSKYIEAAKEGDIIDTLSLKLRKRAAVIPVKFEMNYTEWKLMRDPQGAVKQMRGPNALVKQYFSDASAYNARKGEFGPRDDLEAMTTIVPNYVFFCLLVDEDGSSLECILSMTGTQAKHGRKFCSQIDALELPDGNGGVFKPAIYARLYGLSTGREKNDQGAWMGWKVEPGPMVLKAPGGRALFLKAKAYRDKVDAGEVRAEESAAAAPVQQQAPATATALDDEEIPF